PFTCNSANPLACTLPAGTVPGTYTVTYTATVNDQARAAEPRGGEGKQGPCDADRDNKVPAADPSATSNKQAHTGRTASVGDTITYALTATVSESQLVEDLVLTDTLRTGVVLGRVMPVAPFTCNSANPLACTLPAGTVPGTYTVTYTATVNDQA